MIRAFLIAPKPIVIPKPRYALVAYRVFGLPSKDENMVRTALEQQFHSYHWPEGQLIQVFLDEHLAQYVAHEKWRVREQQPPSQINPSAYHYPVLDVLIEDKLLSGKKFNTVILQEDPDLYHAKYTGFYEIAAPFDFKLVKTSVHVLGHTVVYRNPKEIKWMTYQDAFDHGRSRLDSVVDDYFSLSDVVKAVIDMYLPKNESFAEGLLSFFLCRRRHHEHEATDLQNKINEKRDITINELIRLFAKTQKDIPPEKLQGDFGIMLHVLLINLHAMQAYKDTYKNEIFKALDDRHFRPELIGIVSSYVDYVNLAEGWEQKLIEEAPLQSPAGIVQALIGRDPFFVKEWFFYNDKNEKIDIQEKINDTPSIETNELIQLLSSMQKAIKRNEQRYNYAVNVSLCVLLNNLSIMQEEENSHKHEVREALWDLKDAEIPKDIINIIVGYVEIPRRQLFFTQESIVIDEKGDLALRPRPSPS